MCYAMRFFLRDAAFLSAFVLVLFLRSLWDVPAADWWSSKSLLLLTGMMAFALLVAGLAHLTRPWRWTSYRKHRRTSSVRPFDTAAGTACPKCGAVMRLRMARRGSGTENGSGSPEAP